MPIFPTIPKRDESLKMYILVRNDNVGALSNGDVVKFNVGLSTPDGVGVITSTADTAQLVAGVINNNPQQTGIPAASYGFCQVWGYADNIAKDNGSAWTAADDYLTCSTTDTGTAVDAARTIGSGAGFKVGDEMGWILEDATSGATSGTGFIRCLNFND